MVIALVNHKGGVGKTTCTLNIGAGLQRMGKSVLLIDSDMRKPTFKASDNKKGLTPMLTTDEAVRDNIVATQYQNLWLMPCGPIPPNPADLLATSRFASILAEAKEHFDFVVVDGPPTLGLADSPSLAAVCDGVLMVVDIVR